MDTKTASTGLVKEFRFYTESKMVTIVFQDDSAADFQGEKNYHDSRHACLNHPQPDSADLELTDAKGNTVVVTVVKGTPHETFEA
jgi:hypothetical protein